MVQSFLRNVGKHHVKVREDNTMIANAVAGVPSAQIVASEICAGLACVWLDAQGSASLAALLIFALSLSRPAHDVIDA